jgi:colicin import membrane protein
MTLCFSPVDPSCSFKNCTLPIRGNKRPGNSPVLKVSPINLSAQNSDKADKADESIVKALASIGAAAFVVLILIYATGAFRSTHRMEARSQLYSTGQGISESEPKRQRMEREEEKRLRTVRAAEQQRIAQEEEGSRKVREAERQRSEREEADLQSVTQERVDSEKQRVAQEAERQGKAQQEIEAERQRKAQEEDRLRAAQEAEKKKRDDDLKQCLQTADEAYSANWDRTCRQIDGPPKCILPPLVLARFDGPRRDARDECAKLYPAN